MAIYLYSNPSNEHEIHEVFQSMKDDHVYFVNGVRWDRVWTKPQASFDVKNDPFSSKDFIKATSNKRGSYGDLLDFSKEMSEARKNKLGGHDPVESRFHKQWSKERKGKKHPDVARREGIAKLNKLGVDVE